VNDYPYYRPGWSRKPVLHEFQRHFIDSTMQRASERGGKFGLQKGGVGVYNSKRRTIDAIAVYIRT
jgi:hypothetical protein